MSVSSSNVRNSIGSRLLVPVSLRVIYTPARLTVLPTYLDMSFAFFICFLIYVRYGSRGCDEIGKPKVLISNARISSFVNWLCEILFDNGSVELSDK